MISNQHLNACVCVSIIDQIVFIFKSYYSTYEYPWNRLLSDLLPLFCVKTSVASFINQRLLIWNPVELVQPKKDHLGCQASFSFEVDMNVILEIVWFAISTNEKPLH